MVLMLLVVLCYTICSLSDKYAVSTAKFNGNEFTFLMAASTALFMTVTLPFQDCSITLGWQSVVAVILLAASKMLEFKMSAVILDEISAFELKAWLGIILFVSYFTDVIYGEKLSVLRLLCIAVTVVGLIFIAQSGKKQKINYRRIVLSLVVYLIAKYGYGLIIKAFTPYISSTMNLFLALVLMAVVLLPFAKPWNTFKKNSKGAWVVILTKIPNVAGLLLENAVIAISMANYSFIQPMILVVLFFIGIIRKEESSRLSITGGIVCSVGIVAFQLVGLM